MTIASQAGRLRHSRQGRGFILLAVMILIGASLLLAGSLIHLVRAEAAGAGASVHGEQSRGLAWSGLQAIMADLDEQRRGILAGDLPRLEAQYTIYEDGEFLGVARLLPVGPRGDLLEPEAGKLDLNVVDAAALERTLLIDPALAAAIIAHRDSTLRRPFQSVAELLDVPGMTPQVLYGTGLGAFSASGAEPFIDGASVDGGSTSLDSAGAGSAVIGAEGAARGLADVVTVFAVEPSLQLSGRKRINLNTPWSDELRRRLTDRFGEGIANAVKSIFDQGTTFESDAKIVQILRFFNVPPREWREALDVFSTEESDYRRGRLDLNTASYEALLGLEGLTPDQAAEIARAQADLSAEERATVAWPAMREILTPEQFEKIVGQVTTRSFTYRLRLAAGTVDAIEPDAPLRDPVIYEVVIDLASPRARVAYMRDVTMLRTVVEIAGASPQARRTDDSEEDEGIEKEGLKTADNEGVGLDDLDLDTELDLGGSTAMGASDRSSSGGAMGGGGAAGGGQSPKPGGAPPRIGRWKSGGGGVGSGSGA